MASESHQDMLYRAGWTDERCIDTSEWESQLLNAGYPPISSIVRAFMQNFAGLHIDKHTYREALFFRTLRTTEPYYKPVVDIDFVDPTTSSSWDYWKETLEFISNTIGEPVFPIGVNIDEDEGLAITNQGVIYGNIDHYLLRYTPRTTHPLSILQRFLSRGGEYLDDPPPDYSKAEPDYSSYQEIYYPQFLSQAKAMNASTPKISLRRTSP